MTSLHTIAIFGDSIGRSAGDKTGTTGQGDYLLGTSPTAPYINIGNYGWIERSIAGKYPYYNLSVAGKTAAAFTAALMPKELAIMDKAPPTHAVIEVGVNDFLTGANAATVETRVKNLMALLRGRYSGIKCYITTITPISNTSDAWATLANQFLSGTLPNGVVPSWANFTDNTGTTGRSLYNARVRAGLLGADNYIDASAYCEDATDKRFWKTTAGAATADGIHPNQPTHTDMSLSYDPEVYFG